MGYSGYSKTNLFHRKFHHFKIISLETFKGNFRRFSVIFSLEVKNILSNKKDLALLYKATQSPVCGGSISLSAALNGSWFLQDRCLHSKSPPPTRRFSIKLKRSYEGIDSCQRSEEEFENLQTIIVFVHPLSTGNHDYNTSGASNRSKNPHVDHVESDYNWNHETRD